ncbi:FAD-binding oxidoreductase [Kineosporia sp. A_224]|uniref:FAD-binding protein n=1 Tax=Kineosporia sp. A_224 TaxID=1962180 RepID=UPI000B4A8F75|nr:FAD-binding oxidoreductase [Kineosporia sp. A_224]
MTTQLPARAAAAQVRPPATATAAATPSRPAPSAARLSSGPLLTGWGRSTSSRAAAVVVPRTVSELADALRSADGRAVLARGAGRSYGDAALCADGLVVDMTSLEPQVSLDSRSGLLVAAAGTTFGDVLRVSLPQGWVPPVIPGTSAVTLGGAVAADVHGKNHPTAGSFGHHVRWLVLLDAAGTRSVLTPDGTPERFWATTGGLGLTGIVVTVALQLRPITSAGALTRQTSGRDLGHVLGLLDDAFADSAAADAPDPGDAGAARDAGVHAVAWLDGRARGRGIGRGIVQVTRPGGGPTGLRAARAQRARRNCRSLPGPGVVNRASIEAANLGRWLSRRDGRERWTDLRTALLPLDRGDAWPAAFGRAGLLQYQFAVPHQRTDVLRSALLVLQDAGAPPALAVLKKLGPGNAAPLSFPGPGWTLALDLPARWRHLGPLLERLDGIVAGAGGRVYLVKDSRLRPHTVAAMYPELPAWAATRELMDPGRVFASDLGRRLGLVPPVGSR